VRALPGIERQPRKKLEPSAERLLSLLYRWRDGFFVRFVEPWFGEILGMTGDPYGVPFKVGRA
jgi:hypothetical protein